MYSVVLAAMLTAGPTARAWGHSCHGCCGGYSCCGGYNAFSYSCCGGGYSCCGGGWHSSCCGGWSSCCGGGYSCCCGGGWYRSYWSCCGGYSSCYGCCGGSSCCGGWYSGYGSYCCGGGGWYRSCCGGAWVSASGYDGVVVASQGDRRLSGELARSETIGDGRPGDSGHQSPDGRPHHGQRPADRPPVGRADFHHFGPPIGSDVFLRRPGGGGARRQDRDAHRDGDCEGRSGVPGGLRRLDDGERRRPRHHFGACGCSRHRGRRRSRVRRAPSARRRWRPDGRITTR